ncbi:hypothetical protein P4193_02075 [Pseudomonas aeruginosa]|nr:hypothetical protein [Pseudomonas aeruginosa]
MVRDLIKVCEDELHATFGHRPSRDEVVQGSVESSVLLSLEQLEELPLDEQVAVHRLGTPHIRARVTDGDIEPYICSAPVPFVYDVSCARPLIKPLKNYCPMEEKEALDPSAFGTRASRTGNERSPVRREAQGFWGV